MPAVDRAESWGSGAAFDRAGAHGGPPMIASTPLTLTEFLLARLDEDEEAAQAAPMREWEQGGEFWHRGNPDPTPLMRHVLAHDPARVLAEVAAKRALVAEHTAPPPWEKQCPRCGDVENQVAYEGPEPYPAPCPTLRLLALPHAGHPDYRQEWVP